MSSVRDANSWACFTKPESIFLGLLLAIAGTALAQGDWRSLLALVIALVTWSIVEVHCGLAAGGTACQPGQEEPGASRVLVELDAEFALQPGFLFPGFIGLKSFVGRRAVPDSQSAKI